jgi:hypothetical protein
MVKTVEPKRSAGKSIVSLKVTLRDIKPAIWRRLLVPGTMTLGDLHQAIQAAMGWDNDHLHAFDIAGRQYGDRDTVDDVADENRLTMNSLVKSGVARFAYTYDFGDNWEHLVVIEKRAPAVEVISYPACVAGKRNCPPEDCGGAWSYQHLLEILADPAHPERAEKIEWFGWIDTFDPENFDVQSADAALAARFHSTRSQPQPKSEG